MSVVMEEEIKRWTAFHCQLASRGRTSRTDAAISTMDECAEPLCVQAETRGSRS